MLVIFSGGLLGIALLWSIKLRKKMFYIENGKKQGIHSATHIMVFDHNNRPSIERIEILKTSDEKYFACRFKSQCVKYIYNQKTNEFQITRTYQQDMTHRQLLNSKDIDSFNIPFLREKFGVCQCQTPEPKLLPYLISELTQPYFFLQYFSGIIWTMQGQLFFSLGLIAFSILFTFINYFVFIKKAHKKLQASLKNAENVNILRDEIFIELDSSELVPGDKFILKEGMKLPCDVAILSGELFANEASLTGESLPIAKFPLQYNDKILNFDEDKRHILLEGTVILNIKKSLK